MLEKRSAGEATYLTPSSVMHNMVSVGGNLLIACLRPLPHQAKTCERAEHNIRSVGRTPKEHSIVVVERVDSCQPHLQYTYY